MAVYIMNSIQHEEDVRKENDWDSSSHLSHLQQERKQLATKTEKYMGNFVCLISGALGLITPGIVGARSVSFGSA